MLQMHAKCSSDINDYANRDFWRRAMFSTESMLETIKKAHLWSSLMLTKCLSQPLLVICLKITTSILLTSQHALSPMPTRLTSPERLDGIALQAY